MIIYAPYIADTIPAFTSDKLIIPFAQNPAVTMEEVTGFILMIKNYVDSTSVIDPITINKIIGETVIYDSITKNGSVIFDLSATNWTPEVGMYYKFQLGYLDNNRREVYSYSVVSIGRCIGEYDHYINSLFEDTINKNLVNYVMSYKTQTLSEPIYSYSFKVINKADNSLLINTGEILHNVNEDSIDTINGIKHRISKIEFYVNKELQKSTCYILENTITTVNGHSNTISYQILETGRVPSGFSGQLIVEQDDSAIENGYVNIRIEIPKNTELGKRNGKFILERTNDEVTWEKITEFSIYNGSNLDDFFWKDTSVAAGETYRYAITQYTNDQFGARIYSERIKSNQIKVDFEHMFLTDGKRQLKIAFNPKVSSLKETVLESKMDTIGSKYPFFFRNGQVKYKEIPISGLISYLLDNEEMFFTKEELSILEDTNFSQNLDLNNITAERKFKLAVLEWLNNGELKLFRSATEGNYVVRLMNVSLSPNDTLGRMLHTFSTTGYESADNDLNTLAEKELLNIKAIHEDMEFTEETLHVQNYTEPIVGVLQNIRWYTEQPGIANEIFLDNKSYVNTTGYFTIPENITFNQLAIPNSNKDFTGYIKYKKVVPQIISENIYEGLVNEGYFDTIITFLPNEALQFNQIYKIYGMRVQATDTSKDCILTIDGNQIDCSDGQVRFYYDLPSLNILKGNGLTVTAYVCTQGMEISSSLGEFVLGDSILGLE